jgi:hypothetical protein
MGTVYEYKGTSYELPDGLTNEAALTKIKASLGEAEPVPEVQPEAQTQTQPVQQERGIVDSLGRQIGLTARAGLTGLSYPVNAAMDFISGAYNVGANLAGSEKRMGYLSQEQQKGFTRLGLPEPETGLERAVQAGTQSMASVPAIPVAGMLKNLVQQIPAAGTAGLVAQPTIETVKEITNSDVAATIAGLSLAALVGGATGKTSAKITAEKNPIVTMQDVQQRATRAYTNVDNLGIELNQQGANTLLSQINNRLSAGRYLPENAPEIQTVLNRYQTIIGRGNVSFGNIDQMRQLANDLRVSPDQNIRRLAGEMTSAIDDYVAKLSPSDVSAGAGGIDEAVKTIMGARKDWRNLSRATTLQNILDVADARAANPNASEGELIRQGFINLAANKNKLSVFTPDEQNAIKSVAKGGSLDPILSFIAKFDPTRRNVLGYGAIAGSAVKPEYGVPLVLAGMGSEQMQNFLRARAAQKVQSGLLSGNIKPPPPDYSLRGVLSSIGLLNQ